ncbi:pseudouridine synthase [Corynebacterium atrinae]|nr:pseudouridine synthase [Corynebacterium atrinae]
MVLRGIVPTSPEFWAGSAGDSPFTFGEKLVPGTLLECPQPVWFHPVVPPEPDIPFDLRVLWENPDLIVVDKPGFLPSTSNGRIIRETVQTRLRLMYDSDDIVPLHRLDRLTSGVLLCSRRAKTRGLYQRMFQAGQVRKTYHARVSSSVDFGSEIEVRVDLLKVPGRRAVEVVSDGQGVPTRTIVRSVASELGSGLVEVEPLTGHTHQIRAVLNHLGCPIIGDDTYPVDQGLSLYDFSTPLHLRASELRFEDPISGEQRAFLSYFPLPPVGLSG